MYETDLLLLVSLPVPHVIYFLSRLVRQVVAIFNEHEGLSFDFVIKLGHLLLEDFVVGFRHEAHSAHITRTGPRTSSISAARCLNAALLTSTDWRSEPPKTPFNRRSMLPA